MITVVTSFNEEGWKLYGRRFVETFIKHWPKKVRLLAYHHDFYPTPRPAASNVEYRDLVALSPDLLEFRKKFAFADGKQQGEYNYRLDAQKFCHKVFALLHARTKLHEDYALIKTLDGKHVFDQEMWMLWLDADTMTQRDFPLDALRRMLGDDLVHMGRTRINYSETSFLGFNMERDTVLAFLEDVHKLYVSGELFAYSEHHDGFVFERLINLHRGHGLVPYNLTPSVPDLDAFHRSPLAAYMTHFKGAKKHEGEGQQPFRVNPKSCVPNPTLLEHLDTNSKLFPQWLHHCRPHAGKALIASGGPGTLENIETIRSKQQDGYTIFCVKHSYPTLMKAGIVPFGMIALDPRPYDGISTHDIKRSELIPHPSADVIYLCASMIHPDVTRHLLSHKVRLIGWHAVNQAAESLVLKEGDFLVAGGTCAATRAISIAYILGFRTCELWGYDSCLYNKPTTNPLDELGRPKYLEVGVVGGGKYWTTGELVAQAQDLEELFKNCPADYDVKLFGRGLATDMYTKTLQDKETHKAKEDSFRQDFDTYIKDLKWTSS